MRFSLIPSGVRHRRWLQRLLLMIVILAMGISLGLWQRNQPEFAPSVSFTTIDGEKIKLERLHGKPILVTFWATDCASCVKEIPHLTALYQHYHAQGLEIIAVAMYYDIPSHVVEMTRQKQIPYRAVLDLQASHAKAFGGVQFTPSTFLIAPDGLIAAKMVGAFDPTDLQNKIATYF